MKRNLKDKAIPVLLLLTCTLLLFAAAGWPADESAIGVLRDVELTAVADGKAVKMGELKMGELAKGLPFFLVFSTPT